MGWLQHKTSPKYIPQDQEVSWIYRMCILYQAIYGPLICLLILFHYWSLNHSVQSESYHLRDILCHHMDIWHSSLIAAWSLLAVPILWVPSDPILHWGPLVTCYLLLGNIILGLLKSFVIVGHLIRLINEINPLLVLVEPFCHTWSPYNGAGKYIFY